MGKTGESPFFLCRCGLKLLRLTIGVLEEEGAHSHLTEDNKLGAICAFMRPKSPTEQEIVVKIVANRLFVKKNQLPGSERLGNNAATSRAALRLLMGGMQAEHGPSAPIFTL